MGLKAAVAVMTGKATPVEAAREAVTAAEARVAQEAKRIAGAEEEIARLSDQIASTDPDDASADFAKLVRQRDAARGRLEALQVRASRVARDLEDAKAALRSAEVGAKRERHQAIATELNERSAALSAAAQSFSAKIASELEAFRELHAQGAAVGHELAAIGEKVSPVGSRWLAGWGQGALELAAQIVREQR